MKRAWAAALFCGICLAAPGARADASSGSPAKSGYVYHFDDDRLFGEEMDPCRPRFPPRPAREHMALVRPRIGFVQELLRSVENM